MILKSKYAYFSLRRPTVLMEHELSLQRFYPKSSKSTQQGTGLLSGVNVDFDPQETFEKQIAKGLPPDELFLASFLSGDSCLRGGSGWWFHKICYGKFVRQVHEDSNGRVEVYLGHWIEPEHRVWFERTGRRRQSKLQVTHLYTNGDLCDVTGAPRQCQVKFKCVKTSKASQVTIFLEEPTTCSYSLTVEGSFLCPLLEKTNEIGMITLPQYDTLTTNPEPPTTSSGTRSSDKHQSLSSTQDRVLKQDTNTHSATQRQSAAQESKESKRADSTHKGAASTTPAPSQGQPREESESRAATKQGRSFNQPSSGTLQSQAQTLEAQEPPAHEATKLRHSPNEPQTANLKSQSQVPHGRTPSPISESRESSTSRSQSLPPAEEQKLQEGEEVKMEEQGDLPQDTASPFTLSPNYDQAAGIQVDETAETKRYDPSEDSGADRFNDQRGPSQARGELHQGMNAVGESDRDPSDDGRDRRRKDQTVNIR